MRLTVLLYRLHCSNSQLGEIESNKATFQLRVALFTSKINSRALVANAPKDFCFTEPNFHARTDFPVFRPAQCCLVSLARVPVENQRCWFFYTYDKQERLFGKHATACTQYAKREKCWLWRHMIDL